MQTFRYVAASESDSGVLGAAIASAVPDRLTIGLCGTLGAGKTLLVRAIAESLGVAREVVVSPTFVICQQYEGDTKIYHMDTYRLADEDEFLALGPEEYFAGDAITIIEWADRIESCLPPDRLMIEIQITGAESREFIFVAHGSAAQAMLAAIARRVEG